MVRGMLQPLQYIDSYCSGVLKGRLGGGGWMDGRSRVPTLKSYKEIFQPLNGMLNYFDDLNFPIAPKILHEKFIFLFHLPFHCRHFLAQNTPKKGIAPLFRESCGRDHENSP